MPAVVPTSPRPTVRCCLVVGGARSGKSRYAQELAEASGLRPIYLATATAWDDEMRMRVADHKAARDGRWHTIEAPLDLVQSLDEASSPDRVVLVDCLTLWLTNLVLGDRDVAAATTGLVAWLRQARGPVVLVSNEVGSGIVPDNVLGRTFRDAQGRLNQAVAAHCDGVVLVCAGLPLVLKPNPGPPIDLAV